MSDNFPVKDADNLDKVVATDDFSDVHYPRQAKRAATNEDVVTKAYSFFTGSYQSIGLTNINTSTVIDIINASDGDYVFRFANSGNEKAVIPVGMCRSVPILAGSSEFEGKYITAPTVGSVFFEVRRV